MCSSFSWISKGNITIKKQTVDKHSLLCTTCEYIFFISFSLTITANINHTQKKKKKKKFRGLWPDKILHFSFVLNEYFIGRASVHLLLAKFMSRATMHISPRPIVHRFFDTASRIIDIHELWSISSTPPANSFIFKYLCFSAAKFILSRLTLYASICGNDGVLRVGGRTGPLANFTIKTTGGGPAEIGGKWKRAARVSSSPQRLSARSRACIVAVSARDYRYIVRVIAAKKPLKDTGESRSRNFRAATTRRTRAGTADYF